MANVSAKEVMTAFNTRSDVGRVVISPPERMAQLRLHDTLPMYFCCSRAFLTEESYQIHKTEIEEHGQPIDFTNVRMALNDRKSLAFWSLRKHRAAKKFTDSGEEEDFDDDDDDEANDSGTFSASFQGDGNSEPQEPHNPPMPKLIKVQNMIKPKVKTHTPSGMLYKTCEICGHSLPGCNIPRHMRVAHDPTHQFPCRFCVCRFVSLYGKHIHEYKVHKILKDKNEPRIPRSRKKLVSTKPILKRKPILIKRPVLMVGNKERVLPVEKVHKEQGWDIEQCQNNFVKVGKNQYNCNVCQKDIQGARNIKDHLNSHYGLRPYQCALCPMGFSFTSNLKRHYKSSHIVNGKYVCPFRCGCSMISEIAVKTHMYSCNLKDKVIQRSRKYSFTNVRNVSQKRSLILKKLLETQPKPIVVQKRQYIRIKKSHTANSSSIPTQSPLLSKEVANSMSLKDRFKDKLVGAGRYHCDLCNKDISNSSNFRDHLNCHAGVKPHKCPKCPASFTFKNNIRRHLQTSHVANGIYKCPLNCGCVLSTLLGLNSHLNMCKARQKLNKKLKAMVKVKTEPVSPIKRESVPTPKPSSASNNRQNQNLTDKPEFQCEICHKVVISNRNLKNHMLIHLNLKPFKCNLCKLDFRAIESLKKHRIRSHVPDGKHRCPSCTCQFAEYQGLSMHIALFHTKNWKRREPVVKVEPEELSVLPSKSKLATVIKTEPGVKVNGGVVVNKKKRQVTPRAYLKSVKVANGYECNICKKVLQTPLSLRNHHFIHSGEKPLLCDECPARFRIPSTLADHKRSSHTGGKHKCDLCDCQFHSPLGLVKHKQIYHGINSQTYVVNKARLLRRKALLKVKFTPVHPQRNLSSQPTVEFVTQNSSSSMTNGHHERRPLQSASSVQKQSNSLQPNPNPIRKQVSMKSTSGRSAELFQCGHCSLSLPTLRDLSDHQVVHTIKKQAQHNQEDEFNLSPSSSPTKYPPFCSICDQKIHSSSHYRKHMAACHGKGKFQCKLCPCRYETLGSLSRHQTDSHKNGKIIKKVEMPKPSPVAIKNEKVVVQSRSDRTRPILESPSKQLHRFSCQICGKGFAQQYIYKEHMSMHTNVKNYKCTFCSQRFRTPGILKSHTDKSHGPGTFVCTICPQTRFMTLKGLSVHQYVYHKGGRIGGNTDPDNQSEQNISNGVGSSGSGSQAGRSIPMISRPSSTMTTTTRRNGPAMPAPSREKFSPKSRPIACKICRQLLLGPDNLIEHMKLHQEPNYQVSPLRPPPLTQKKFSFPVHEEPQEESYVDEAGPTEEENYYNSSYFNQEEENYDEDVDRPTIEIVNDHDDYGIQHDQIEMEEHEEDENPYESYHDNSVSVDYIQEEEEEMDYGYEVVGGGDAYDPMAMGQNNQNHYQNHGYVAEDDDDVEIELHDNNDFMQYYDSDSNEDDALPQPIQCQGCGLSFLSRSEFSVHVQVYDDAACPYCCTADVTGENLQDHNEEYHSIDEIEFLESQR